MFSFLKINPSWLPEFTSLPVQAYFGMQLYFLLFCSFCASPVYRAELILVEQECQIQKDCYLWFLVVFLKLTTIYWIFTQFHKSLWYSRSLKMNITLESTVPHLLCVVNWPNLLALNVFLQIKNFPSWRHFAGGTQFNRQRWLNDRL